MRGDSPFKEYWNFFNFYQLIVVSSQCGCDVPERKVTRDTPFDAKFENNVMSVNWAKVEPVVAKYVKADYVIVLVQRGEKGSSVMAKNAAVVGLRGSPQPAGTPDKTWGPEWGLQSLIHELGHSIGKCGDEYFVKSPFGPPAETEPDCPNVTRETSLEKIKWKHWIEPGTPLPTPGGNQTGGPVGLFEGAYSAEKGFYRPYAWCAMRGRAVGGENPFCPVCREAVLLQLYKSVKPLANITPSAENEIFLGKETQSFQAEVLAPTDSSVKLEFIVTDEKGEIKKEHGTAIVLQGKKQKKDIYPASHKLDSGKLKPGKYTLTLKYSDQTPFVRRDPDGILCAKCEWRLVIE
jgi:hypothetical protein